MIYIANDHAGFELKNKIVDWFNKKNQSIVDLGTDSNVSADYPVFAKKIADNIKPDDFGILICGSGIGMSIAVNRFDHIRGALCFTKTMAKLARNHNNANVLILSSRNVSKWKNIQIITTFFNNNFDGGRHEKRVNMLNDMHNI